MFSNTNVQQPAHGAPQIHTAVVTRTYESLVMFGAHAGKPDSLIILSLFLSHYGT